MSTAIAVERLSKSYARYAHRRRFATLKSALLGGSLLSDLRPQAVVEALSDISFRVPAGATVAIVGPNGSGKSTLLKVLAGILKPTSGRVEVEGRIAALLELGAGFHPEVSGRENIVINGIMLGLSRREIERKVSDIVAFAGLEDFIDAPVKTYSSGMYVRLGFSVAVAVEPDVLLVDEVLAVGDEAFSHKCIDRFKDLKRRGRTVLLVTHALELAEGLADEAILIEGGRLTAQGLPRAVTDRYRGHVDAAETAAVAAENLGRAIPAAGGPAPAEPAPEGDSPAAEAVAAAPSDPWEAARWGSRAVEIERVGLAGPDARPALVLHTGEPFAIEIQARAHEAQEDFVFGIAFRTRDGHLAYGTNTDIEGFRPRRFEGTATVRIRFPALALLADSYALDVAVHRKDGFAFDYRKSCLTFVVRSLSPEVGVARLEHAWQFEGVALDPRDAGA